MKVAILGASPKKDRYSYKAMKSLMEHGHKVYLVNQNYDEIEGKEVLDSLEALSDEGIEVHTLTLYVNAEISSELKDEILELRPKRVIFNPGAENPSLMESLKKKKIEVLEACTLVLLSTDQF